MRNSKVKGFTLVELIVVIAIIAILAAILVPNMLGYIKDSRYSQADANAKNVHTAATAAMAKLYADGKIGAGTLTDSPLITASNLSFSVTVGQTATIDLENGLGTQFKGSAKFEYDNATGSVTRACWTASETGTGLQWTRNKKTDNTIIGLFPTPADGT